MRCAVCPGRAVQQHHILSRQFLKREGYKGRMDDPRNLMDLCLDCHMNHENRSRGLTRTQVPPEAFAFARELGEFAVVRLERDYPVHDQHAAPAGTYGA